jgi:hypothetical protein
MVDPVADPGSWCILRTSGRHTIRLAGTLNAAGIEAWSPVEPKMIRVPRKNVRRQIIVPMMASYVFAKADRMVDLLRLADTEERARHGVGWAHPEFRVMMRQDGPITIEDGQFVALRQIEGRRARSKRADMVFNEGVRVRVGSGIAGGLVGSVTRSNRKSTAICIGPNFIMTFSTSILSLDDLGDGQP